MLHYNTEKTELRYAPTDVVNGFRIRPGKYLRNGATIVDGGVSFTIHSNGATACNLCLFHINEDEPYAVIPFPDSYRIGNTYSMVVFDINPREFEYAYQFDGEYDEKKGLRFDKNNYILDPYARVVADQHRWCERTSMKNTLYKARVVESNFEWGNFKQPNLEPKDMIIYEMHVRGFTMHPSSGVEKKHRGTFEGIREKIPYLLELGVNAVELMPIFEFDELEAVREYEGKKLINYWGYSPVCFFAPNTSYASEEEDLSVGNEFRELVHELNSNGIEVILDVVFNHTAEGNEMGPSFSFKGMDNNIYYMLTPDGKYYNFSGCGNVMNCNHPIVQQFILECLRYWVVSYRVDGFRFDLAAIMGRNEDGSPMSKPPLLQSLAFDPILGRVKLIAEAWDAGGLYQVGSFPSWNRWAEWNGRYRDDMRCFLKGDYGMAQAAINRITGSLDLYGTENRAENATVNFLNCHDGFTLYDMYAYNNKHNEKNGWYNTDGDNCNNSWNCGVEGETDDPEVLELRNRMRKNAFAILMCSRGSAMFYAGDEFCNTQFGNNNAYCQDNEISWLDWTRKDKYNEMFEFCKFMIHLRRKHPILRGRSGPSGCGFPEVSVHNKEAWNSNCGPDTRTLGIMFAGRTAGNIEDDIIYIGINSFWERQNIQLPNLPLGRKWRVIMNTEFTHTKDTDYHALTSWVGNDKISMCPRSVVIAVVEKY
ncbi:MAG: glycogen debranching enzyme [Lachnospiraceae bacterium]|nr:glycogen debranching enzyme [Lachnospiraceae bacterium]MBQ5849301.1 glycogen debranching enzyme [Lachnospiraceae bacterium]